jgi:glycosyltransferase involved in cell wall biosynthesis
MKLMVACRAIDNMAGGVERQAIALVNEMSQRGHETRLFTLDDAQAKTFYDIDPSVHWEKLGVGNPKVKANWRVRYQRMKKVRAIVRDFNPDVILAFQQGMFLSLYLYTGGMGIPVVAAERESPFRYDFLKSGQYRKLMAFQSFRLAPHITVQCNSYVEAYPQYLQSKMKVIPNAIYPSEIRSNPGGNKGQSKILLCIGRLSYQKNQLVLLDAFARLAKDFSEWKLVLAGEGEGRAEIESKITTLDITEKVDVLGAVKDVTLLYANAHALCIPSRWEGFPNVLGESMAHGLPAVGYEGCGGVRDLITHGQDGILAKGNEGAKDLEEALHIIMSDDAGRLDLGANALEAIQQYVPARVYSQWENFLLEVASAS